MPPAGGDEGTHGGAAAEEPTPAEPEAAGEEGRCGGQGPTRTEGGGEENGCIDEVIGIATTKRAMSGIDVLLSVSSSLSIELMSLSSKPVAAAAQGLLLGVPILKR